MDFGKIKEKFSQENLSKQKDKFDTAAIAESIKGDRFSAICWGLIGLSVLLLLSNSFRSESHPSKLLSSYISAAEEADFEAMREIAPSKSYQGEADALGSLYFEDVREVVKAAQIAGGNEIRSGFLNFVEKKAKFAEAVSEDEDFRKVPWPERPQYLENKWNKTFGSNLAYVSDLKFNAYGIASFSSQWNSIVEAYRGRGYLNWRERNSLDKDVSAQALMSDQAVRELIEAIVDASDRNGIQSQMASIGWTRAAASGSNASIVGSMTYTEAMDRNFMNHHGSRLLPLAVMAFYDEEHGVSDRESDVAPAGEGLYQPGSATASLRVKGGTVFTSQYLENGRWKIQSLTDIRDVGVLYREIKSNSNAFAPGASPASNEEG